MSGLTWRALHMLPQSSVKSYCKVKGSGRCLGLMSIDYKSHFHVTVMKRSLVNPLFKGWAEWDKCKIKNQTALPFSSTLKPVFLIDQTTPQFSVNVHRGQVHSHWTPLELIHSPLQRGMPAFPTASRTGGNKSLTRRQTGLFQGEGCSGKTKSAEWPLWMVQTSSHRAQGA